jgi:hypothetical protein
LVAALIQEWTDRAAETDAIEFVVTIDADRSGDLTPLATLPRTRVVLNRGRPCCVDGWNLAARKAKGNILVQCSDDLHPPVHWDMDIRARLGEGTAPLVLATSDGLTASATFIPHAIVTRRYYSDFGYLFHDAYWSMWSDNELSAVAHRRNAVIEALDIRFVHTHGRFNDDVRSRHEAPAFHGGGQSTFLLRQQHGFEPWTYGAFAAEDDDSDGLYSPNWRTRLPSYWTTGARSDVDCLALHRDSHDRRLQRFGGQPPIEGFQALITTIPERCQFFELLTAELARQGVTFLSDARRDVSEANKHAVLLARATARYVTFMDDDTWVSHNYGELVADAIAHNRAGPDVILHDLVGANGEGPPRPIFFSFDRAPADLPECRLSLPDHSMVWRRECADNRRATSWARVRGFLRFHESAPRTPQ